MAQTVQNYLKAFLLNLEYASSLFLLLIGFYSIFIVKWAIFSVHPSRLDSLIPSTKKEKEKTLIQMEM